MLQRDARDLTGVDKAKTVGVTDGTVRNRIDDLVKRIRHHYVRPFDRIGTEDVGGDDEEAVHEV